ncbi:hypothetical protein NESM_000261900 [Novymonas esmeraldas]|uniref:Uncharacterized protein n=1 Tax=Novymonas esmeraldas TaxID=1808958 RepID=A0AAW0FDP3_9TRYP
MPTREESEEAPVFSQPSTSGTNVHRDDTPQSQAEREPIRTQDMRETEVLVPAALERSDVDAEGRPKESIEEQVARIIIHDDRPIEHLPVMMAPELKLIGRCVSLCVKQSIAGAPVASYYYTGLVATVTASSVTLMHVYRYTRADFKVYKAREQRLAQGDLVTDDAQDNGTSATLPNTRTTSAPLLPTLFYTAAGATPRPPAPSDSAAVAQDHRGGAAASPGHRYSREGAVDVAEDGGLASAQDPSSLRAMDAAGSLTPAVPVKTDAEIESEGAAAEREQEGAAEGEEAAVAEAGNCTAGGSGRGQRLRHVRNYGGSMGPIPYVTFLRKTIYNVEFGRDPRSAFYSLFQDPAKQFTDMQYLRMFVRRYLVHTSQGNNPREVPLYAFVSVRGAWPALDRELVNQIVHEELPRLLMSDGAIRKEKKRQRAREEQREQDVREYRAPAGLFHRTGILFLTRIPQSSFLAAMILLLFTVAFSVYLGVMLSVTSDALIVSFVMAFMRNFIASIVIWGVAGVFIVLHAIAVHLPLGENSYRLFFRVLCTLGALGCCIMCFFILLSKMSNRALYQHMANPPYGALCDFYTRHQCSGFFVGCGYSNDSYDLNLCSPCPNTADYRSGCFISVWSQLQLVSVPLLVFIIFIMIADLYALFLMVKLVLLAKAISGRFF